MIWVPLHTFAGAPASGGIDPTRTRLVQELRHKGIDDAALKKLAPLMPAREQGKLILDTDLNNVLPLFDLLVEGSAARAEAKCVFNEKPTAVEKKTAVANVLVTQPQAKPAKATSMNKVSATQTLTTPRRRVCCMRMTIPDLNSHNLSARRSRSPQSFKPSGDRLAVYLSQGRCTKFPEKSARNLHSGDAEVRMRLSNG